MLSFEFLPHEVHDELSYSCTCALVMSFRGGSRNSLKFSAGMVDQQVNMGASKKLGYPKIIHFNKVFHHKPSILGYP